MKNFFLIGDSIRFGAEGSPGYGVIVRNRLKTAANVFQPAENCRFAQYTLRYLHEWAAGIDGASVDAVHWNNGLWDVLRLFGDEPFTPVDMYAATLERIHRRIRFLFPNARVIFATNTTVMEEWGNPDFFRYNSEIEQYNRAAEELMHSLGAEINDLYAVTAAMGPEYRSDWVHYNEAGSAILADRVIASLMK